VAETNETRCGFVALIGSPNAGKSTLTNRLVGTKVSIVSHKVQTTRSTIRGIVMKDRTQIVFVDTPGIFAPKKRLERALVDTAWGGARDADVVALIVDARKGIDDEVQAILDRLKDVRQPRLLILNKVDLVKRENLLALAAEATGKVPFERVFMVSALTGDGVEDITDYLAGVMPLGPYLFPEDEISDLPLRNLASEITREKVFNRLHDELPYSSTVETEKYEDRPDGSVRIEQVIYVDREGQRKIILGKGGATIKEIGHDSRIELSSALGQKVHLFLFVKVRENWADDPERYREMGIEFPKN
jgi:GTP-binding protein Era